MSELGEFVCGILPQARLAELLGITRQYLNLILSGRMPCPRQLMECLRHIGCPEDLLNGLRIKKRAECKIEPVAFKLRFKNYMKNMGE